MLPVSLSPGRLVDEPPAGSRSLLRRLVAKWRAAALRRETSRAVQHLTPHLRRDIGLPPSEEPPRLSLSLFL